MTSHLTDQQLIDHGFNIESEAEAAQVAAHLESCAECRARLSALMHQTHASLDLLKDVGDPPDDLVARTLAHVQHGAEQERTATILRMPHITMFGTLAAAAVLVMAVVLWWPAKNGQQTAGQADARADGQAMPKAHVAQSATTPAEPIGKNKRLAQAAAQEADMPFKSIDKLDHTADLFARKPFAPANNIELNVLPRRENVELTIYNDADLTLVREQRSLTLQRGWNWLQYMWANTLIDPTSLMLEPMTNQADVEVQELVFPPRLREVGRWLIASKVSGSVPFELRNFTSGLSWEAVYNATLATDEKSMRLNGFVRVNNKSGEDYENAQVRLVVGKINVIEPIRQLAQQANAFGRRHDEQRSRGAGNYTDEWGYTGAQKKADMKDFNGGVTDLPGYLEEMKNIAKEGLSEYVLYTIEGREDLENGWSKRLQSFDACNIAVTNVYKYDEERWNTQVMRFITTMNTTNNNLGQTPLPNGRVVVSRVLGDDQHLAYIGQTRIKYIPVNDEIEMNLGAVQNVTVEPTLMDFETLNHQFDRNGNVCGWDETRRWDVKIANTRDLSVNVEITRGMRTPKWSVDSASGAQWVKHDATHLRFTLTVPAGTKTNVVYEVVTKHGTRE